jgi:hypothetical protein
MRIVQNISSLDFLIKLLINMFRILNILLGEEGTQSKNTLCCPLKGADILRYMLFYVMEAQICQS